MRRLNSASTGLAAQAMPRNGSPDCEAMRANRSLMATDRVEREDLVPAEVLDVSPEGALVEGDEIRSTEEAGNPSPAEPVVEVVGGDPRPGPSRVDRWMSAPSRGHNRPVDRRATARCRSGRHPSTGLRVTRPGERAPNTTRSRPPSHTAGGRVGRPVDVREPQATSSAIEDPVPPRSPPRWWAFQSTRCTEASTRTKHSCMRR